MLESAGCSLIAVHGRLRGSCKRRRQGPANLNAIRRIKQAVRIPVISNGNIRTYGDAVANLVFTGADGVMSAEALLANPALFSGKTPDPFDLCHEYLNFCARYGAPPADWIRHHLKNILRRLLKKHEARRRELLSCPTEKLREWLDGFRKVVAADGAIRNGIGAATNEESDEEEAAEAAVPMLEEMACFDG